MKKFLILSLLLFAFNIAAKAQVGDPKFIYCTLLAQNRLFSNKVSITLDFGDRMRTFADNRLRDKRGKPIIFNTVVDALNFMGARGWELVQVYSLSQNSGSESQVQTTWILKKAFLDFDEDARNEYRKSMEDE